MVLESILKHGEKVKRVVITSSFGSIVDSRKKRPYKFTEQDWNTESTGLLKENDKDICPGDAYKAGKTLAEKAAWQFIKDNKPKWDWLRSARLLFSVPSCTRKSSPYCPRSPEGAAEFLQVKSPVKLNESAGQLYGWLNGSKEGGDTSGNLVDVRDLAHAHVQAISIEEAGSKRFAVAKQPYTLQLCLDELYVDGKVMKSWLKLPKGNRGADKVEDQNGEPRCPDGILSLWREEAKATIQFWTLEL